MGVVSGVWIEGQRDVVTTGLFEGGDHDLGFGRRYHGVFCAVKCPAREGAQRPALGLVGQQNVGTAAATAYGSNRCKALGIFQTQAPRAVTTHAQTGQVHPVGINAESGNDVVQQRQQRRIIPDLSRRALRRNEDEREFFFPGRQFRRAVLRDQGDIGAAFTGTV